MNFQKAKGQNKTVEGASNDAPALPFHQLTVHLNNGSDLPLASFEGKKVLLVNTASNCGYTNQYEDLQKLYDSHKDKLVVIGFPANDFKEQEKGSDEEIAQFCQVNFGVTFPLAKKSVVVKGEAQNSIFRWLTSKEKNGWNEQQPTWNFSKYLVNENGILTHYFEPSVSPLDPEVIEAIER
jgi:glutathione peroxidase